MILSDKTIKRMLRSGEICIDPISENQIQPASVDLTLGDHYLRLDENNMTHISMTEPVKHIEVFSDSIIIPPFSFILATTLEYIEIPNNLAGIIEGRSSIGRMGLFIHNAGWVDPGFKGTITLELYNANRLPVQLISGKRICQIVFMKLDSEVENPYKGKYQGQDKTTGSKIFKDD